MATIELALTFSAIVVAASAAIYVAWACKSEARSWVRPIVLLASIFAARWLLTTPMFVHAAFHGMQLLNAPFENPTESIRNYGPFGSLVQGSVMHLFGADLSAVAFANQFFGVATLGWMAWLARRWTGSPSAAGCVLAVAAFNPVLMRQGSSEDAHSLAVMLAWLALCAMEQYATRAWVSALLISVAATGLMVETRQIMFAFVPLVPLWGFMRASRPQTRSLPLVVATTGMLAILALRLFDCLTDPIQAGHVATIGPRLGGWDAIQFALATHPALDVGRFAFHLIPLQLIGVAWLLRSGWTGRVFVLAWLGIFASSLWLYEGQNVALMFRLPVLTLCLFIAGLGAWRIAEESIRLIGKVSIDERPRRIVVYGVLILGLLIAPVLQPGWQILQRVTPLTREYRYIQSMLPLLPKEIRLVTEASRADLVWDLPSHLFRQAGIVIRSAESDAPRIYVHGIRCRAYSLSEVFGFTTIAEVAAMPPEKREQIAAVLAGKRVDNIPVPSTERPECQRILADATPLGQLENIDPFPDDPPFLLFSPEKIPVQIFQLPEGELPVPVYYR